MSKSSMNMTEGNILKSLIYFAIPVLIGNILQQLYNVADTAIIGNILGDNALASVGASAPVYGLITGFAGGFTNGLAVIISRYFGANDEISFKKSVTMSYVLSAIISLIMTVVGIFTIKPLMTVLKTPPEIISDTVNYMRIIIAFSVVTVAYNMIAAMMRAIGNSQAPLYFLAIATFANIGLDFLFIKTFNMGVAGAGYATVIAQGISVILCFVYASKKCDFLIFKKSGLVWDKELFSDLLSTGMSMGLMYAIVSIGSVILQGSVNSFGTSTITAHTSARKIDEIFMMPLSTMSMATATFVSQNFGAKKIDRVKQGIKYSLIITAVWSAISIIITVFFRRPLIQALSGTSDVSVISTASQYVIWNISFFFVLGILLTLRSSLQSVDRKIIPITGSIIEFLLKIVASAIVAPKLGYFGICILEPVIWTVCAVIVFVDYVVFIKQSNAVNENNFSKKHLKSIVQV